jgi:hypothetical protein
VLEIASNRAGATVASAEGMTSRIGLVGLGLLVAMEGCGSSTALDTSGAGNAGGGGSGPDWGSCDAAGDCVLLPTASCCGHCGEQTLEASVAIARDQMGAFYDAQCAPEAACPEDPPDCNAVPDDHLFAYCKAGSCAKADVRAHELSACVDGDECTLRWRLECCPGCASQTVNPEPYADLVAIRADAEATLASLVCTGAEDCGPCEPQLPSEATAACVAGHCQVVIAMP